jgi:hypothetical protein
VKEETKKAIRSLPWYVVGSILFFPLVTGIFTGGVGFLLYAAYFSDGSGQILMLAALVGLGAWIIRQFFRAMLFAWRKEHIVRYTRF